MKPLPKQYDHAEAEPRLQKRWEESGVYQWDETAERADTFVIDTPPPTVSGVLHMGHIFSYTQADFVARFQRMRGKTVFYPMGFDDNGLPTERLVEKEKKVRGSAMPREAFVALCREVVKSAEDEFRGLFKSVALSIDWRQEYQTVSDEVRAISQASFLDLLARDEAYRDFRPTYWDWVDQTAIAQAEIENKEMPGVMNELRFALESGEKLLIMTTRPELLGACVAVMYHPEDPNAVKYEGKTAVTPLFGVKVPMVADSGVERDKGTGLVMCCTFGDDTDKDWWRKHAFPMRPILSTEGKIAFIERGEGEGKSLHFTAARDGSEAKYGAASLAALTSHNTADIDVTVKVFSELQGLKPKQANAKIIELLQASGWLAGQTPMTHSVKCAERSGTPIEIIPTHQWFIRITDKKDALLAKGMACGWHPEFMRLRLAQWIEGLKEDWCISRQRFFGVPFPAWLSRRVGEEGKVIPANLGQLPVDPLVDLPEGYGKNEVTPIADVMDTWATSSLSPQINARGIGAAYSKNPERYSKLFPADLRPQAHEIIRTWAFYTIVKAHLHADSIPWHHLMISGWCLAADKTKMSKSKGNVITPVDLILTKSADVVRYWASTSRLGADTAFSEDLLKIGKKLVTKLWNATNFACIHLEKLINHPANIEEVTEALDRWILSRLRKTVAKATDDFTRFEYCDARVAIEEFFWKDFCDNYLELVKARAYGEMGDETAQRSAHVTLYYVLDAILRLFAPFVPHVTEELYSHLFEEKNSLHGRGMWPDAAFYPENETAELSGMAAVSVLEAVRKAKSERSLSIKFPIRLLRLSPGPNGGSQAGLMSVLADLQTAANAESAQWVEAFTPEIVTEDKRFGLSIMFGEPPPA